MRTYRWLRDPVWWAACLLYVANRCVRPWTGPGILRSHFNDFLLIPAALPLVLWLQGVLRLRTEVTPPGWMEIGFHLCVWSVLFEVIGPRLLPVTGDPWDILAYALGGVAAGLWWNRGWAGDSTHEL